MVVDVRFRVQKSHWLCAFYKQEACLAKTSPIHSHSLQLLIAVLLCVTNETPEVNSRLF